MSRKNDVKCFKVLSKYGRVLESLYGWNSGEVFSITYYADGRLTKPNKNQNPYLFVYKKLEDAKRDHVLNHTEIWECRANNLTDKIPSTAVKPVPVGTHFCNSLRLIKRVNI